jgi:spore coat polysaccharide biosynthesis protein SpsF (cytidylyltransferase family)
MSSIAIVQARLGSSRLPKKVLMKLGDTTVIELIVSRLRKALSVDQIVVAIPDNDENDSLANFLREKEIEFFRGDEHDVLSRFVNVFAGQKGLDILRVTADCPLVEPKLIDELFNIYKEMNVDYAAIATGAGVMLSDKCKFPDGLDSEWVKSDALVDADKNAKSDLFREHATSFIWRENSGFSKYLHYSDLDYSHLSLTLDTPEDLEFFKELIKTARKELIEIEFRDVVSLSQCNNKLLAERSNSENYAEFYKESS